MECFARRIEATGAVQPRPERDRLAGGVKFVAGRDGGDQPRETLRRELQGDDLGGRNSLVLDRLSDRPKPG